MWSEDSRVGVCRWLVCLLLAGALSGCSSKGPATGDVSGTITFAGKAPDLEGLQIHFMPTREAGGGPVVSAVVNKDGSFTAKGVRAGQVQVSLTYTDPTWKAAQEEYTAALEKAKKNNPQAAMKYAGKFDLEFKQSWMETHPGFGPPPNPIPKELQNPQTSGKSLEVEANQQNTWNWDIQLMKK